MNIDPQLKSKIKEYHNNYKLFAKDCLKIKDHNTSKILPLVFNNGQRILNAISEKVKKEFGFIRMLLLKTRRFGGSTDIEGRFYWKSSLNSNRNTFIMGHEERSTKTLYAMATLMQEQNPIAPTTLKSNAQELIFDNQEGTGLKSQYELATARNVHAARAQGIHYLHLSEEAFYPDNAPELLDGIFQCVPDPPAESEIFRESTANGFGNTFQQDVFKAYAEGQYPYYQEKGITYAWRNPLTDWVLVFIPWFVHNKHVKEFNDDKERQAFVEKLKEQVFDKDNMQWVESEASKLKNKYNLTLEQLNWRAWAIENKCRGSIDKFNQEYPSTVEEAFLSTGTNVFGKELCDQLEVLCEKPALIGDVVVRAGKSKIRPNKHGHFSIWEKPDDKETYFIVIDSAGGKKIKHKEGKQEPDYTCIDVYNHRTGLQAAQWHGHIDYDLIADTAEMIGNMFFLAPACVELQNHGYTIVAELLKKKYPMYEYKPDEPGYSTNRKTKPLMVDSLYQMARDGDIQIRCASTVSEMRTFKEESGVYEAEQGCKDDRVTTAAMGSQMMTLMPKKFKDLRDKSRKSKGEFTGFTNWEHRNINPDDGGYKEMYV